VLKRSNSSWKQFIDCDIGRANNRIEFGLVHHAFKTSNLGVFYGIMQSWKLASTKRFWSD
jgi:hypothetical protein